MSNAVFLSGIIKCTVLQHNIVRYKWCDSGCPCEKIPLESTLSEHHRTLSTYRIALQEPGQEKLRCFGLCFLMFGETSIVVSHTLCIRHMQVVPKHLAQFACLTHTDMRHVTCVDLTRVF